jgi:cyanophycin synthetase
MMKVNRVRYLKGPNYFNYRPTLWVELDLEDLEFQPSDTLPGFSDTLLSLLPTLKKHTCSRGYEGAFAERLYEGTWMGHILEHISIELQNLAGIDVKHGKTITSEKQGIYFVTFEYKEPKSAKLSFDFAMDICESIINGVTELPIKDYIDKISAAYYDNKLGPSTEAIFQAAERMMIPAERIGQNSLVRLGTGIKQKYVQATISSQTSYLAVENSCDKQATKDLLSAAGLPVPKGEVVSSADQLLKAAERIGYPVVIKPQNGRQGQGVITNISNKEELFSVSACMDMNPEDYIIERYYEGDDFRLLVVNEQLIAASLRLPPFVIGNGEDTIAKLIDKENENSLRGEGHEKAMTKIPMNSTVTCFLEKNGFSLNYIPEMGQIVQVAGNANLSTGGQAIDVTDEVHPTIKEVAIQAAKAVGLDIAGIDMISKDISAPFNPDTSAILEVNAAPGIRMHHHPSKGKKRDVGKAIVDYLFKDRSEAAIPVVAVTGTNGKTTTVRLVKHFLEGKYSTVGMTNSDGVYIGSQCIDQGDCSGPISARKILSNPKVEAAVLETARGGILREGLAFRYCDVGIVTNVAEDHLGLDGIETFDQLVKLKRLIPEVVHEDGYCILNADDPEVVEMADYTKGKRIFTALSCENMHIRTAILKGEEAWYVNTEGEIIYSHQGKSTVFLPVKDIPITINGAAKHNISNLLQALAAAYSQGVSMEILKEKTLTFIPDFKQSRGRFNLIELEGRHLIVDYAHNRSGLKALFETVRDLNERTIITVIAAPGDRCNQDILDMGLIAASQSDHLILKEDVDLRGRKQLEVPLLMKSAAENVLPAERIHVIPEELEAYYKAWELSNIGDTLLLLYEDFTLISQFIKRLNKQELVDQ